MPDLAASILAHLAQVTTERRLRSGDPALSARVVALKAYQQHRFASTHADLLADPRYGAAARFFLDDLYGPQDFAERDAQFVRIVPALVKLFPPEIVATVDALAELHGLSETLDSEMARRLPGQALDAAAYVQAWQATGRPSDRARQIDLVLAVGTQLDKYTRNRWMRQSLKFMRAPARAAGLHALQAFLEKGFDTFADIGDAKGFLG
ncbi:MAG TPA: hypothetical protein VLA16_27730, partial [Ideonella sp.]|nr:hypothetical protein [Ideonella sp.]